MVISLTGLSGVVLSHNHHDHASGFLDLMSEWLSCPVLYAGIGFFDAKFSRCGRCDTYLSGRIGLAMLERNAIEHVVVKSSLEVLQDCILSHRSIGRMRIRLFPNGLLRNATK